MGKTWELNINVFVECDTADQALKELDAYMDSASEAPSVRGWELTTRSRVLDRRYVELDKPVRLRLTQSGRDMVEAREGRDE